MAPTSSEMGLAEKAKNVLETGAEGFDALVVTPVFDVEIFSDHAFSKFESLTSFSTHPWLVALEAILVFPLLYRVLKRNRAGQLEKYLAQLSRERLFTRGFQLDDSIKKLEKSFNAILLKNGRTDLVAFIERTKKRSWFFFGEEKEKLSLRFKPAGVAVTLSEGQETSDSSKKLHEVCKGTLNPNASSSLIFSAQPYIQEMLKVSGGVSRPASRNGREDLARFLNTNASQLSTTLAGKESFTYRDSQIEQFLEEAETFRLPPLETFREKWARKKGFWKALKAYEPDDYVYRSDLTLAQASALKAKVKESRYPLNLAKIFDKVVTEKESVDGNGKRIFFNENQRTSLNIQKILNVLNIGNKKQDVDERLALCINVPDGKAQDKETLARLLKVYGPSLSKKLQEKETLTPDEQRLKDFLWVSENFHLPPLETFRQRWARQGFWKALKAHESSDFVYRTDLTFEQAVAMKAKVNKSGHASNFFSAFYGFLTQSSFGFWLGFVPVSQIFNSSDLNAFSHLAQAFLVVFSLTFALVSSILTFSIFWGRSKAAQRLRSEQPFKDADLAYELFAEDYLNQKTAQGISPTQQRVAGQLPTQEAGSEVSRAVLAHVRQCENPVSTEKKKAAELVLLEEESFYIYKKHVEQAIKHETLKAVRKDGKLLIEDPLEALLPAEKFKATQEHKLRALEAELGKIEEIEKSRQEGFWGRQWTTFKDRGISAFFTMATVSINVMFIPWSIGLMLKIVGVALVSAVLLSNPVTLGALGVGFLVGVVSTYYLFKNKHKQHLETGKSLIKNREKIAELARISLFNQGLEVILVNQKIKEAFIEKDPVLLGKLSKILGKKFNSQALLVDQKLSSHSACKALLLKHGKMKEFLDPTSDYAIKNLTTEPPLTVWSATKKFLNRAYQFIGRAGSGLLMIKETVFGFVIPAAKAITYVGLAICLPVALLYGVFSVIEYHRNKNSARAAAWLSDIDRRLESARGLSKFYFASLGVTSAQIRKEAIVSANSEERAVDSLGDNGAQVFSNTSSPSADSGVLLEENSPDTKGLLPASLATTPTPDAQVSESQTGSFLFFRYLGSFFAAVLACLCNGATAIFRRSAHREEEKGTLEEYDYRGEDGKFAFRPWNTAEQPEPPGGSTPA